MNTTTYHIRYNQKQVLLDEISKYIEAEGSESLLDIGAGDGVLAIPLSKKLKTYFAIEPNPERAEKLRAAGIRVKEGIFPCEVEGAYDIVLSSHSIPEDMGHWQEFLQAAWSLVKPGGMLLIITFKGVRDDGYDLHRELGFVSAVEDADRKELEKIMSSFGALEKRFPRSMMETENLDELVKIVSLAVGGTDEEKIEYRPKLQEILEARYKKGDTYWFPTEHLFLSVRRPK
jgi:SAM-dependent methyltransferase